MTPDAGRRAAMARRAKRQATFHVARGHVVTVPIEDVELFLAS